MKALSTKLKIFLIFMLVFHGASAYAGEILVRHWSASDLGLNPNASLNGNNIVLLSKQEIQSYASTGQRYRLKAMASAVSDKWLVMQLNFSVFAPNSNGSVWTVSPSRTFDTQEATQGFANAYIYTDLYFNASWENIQTYVKYASKGNITLETFDYFLYQIEE